MGCDIHSFVAVLGDDGTLSPSETYVNLSEQRRIIKPFDDRCYLFFGWLTDGGVRSSGLFRYNYPYTGKCKYKINPLVSDSV